MGRPVNVHVPGEKPESIVERAVRKLLTSFPDKAPVDALSDRELFTQEECMAWLNSLNAEQQRILEHDWLFRARPKQRPPKGNWKNWLIIAGRGWGKHLSLNTDVYTLNAGWKKWRDVSVEMFYLMIVGGALTSLMCIQ